MPIIPRLTQTLFHAVKAVVRAVKTFVYAVKVFVYAVKVFVYAVKVFIHTVKTSFKTRLSNHSCGDALSITPQTRHGKSLLTLLIFGKIDISPSLAYHFRQLNFTLCRERSDYR